MMTLKTAVHAVGFSAALALAGTPALAHADPAPPAAQHAEPAVPATPAEAELLRMREATAAALEDFRGGDRTYTITGTTIVIILLVLLVLIIIL